MGSRPSLFANCISNDNSDIRVIYYFLFGNNRSSIVPLQSDLLLIWFIVCRLSSLFPLRHDIAEILSKVRVTRQSINQSIYQVWQATGVIVYVELSKILFDWNITPYESVITLIKTRYYGHIKLSYDPFILLI